MEESSKKDKYLEWLAEEMLLNQKHEELLARREVLLANTSSVYQQKEKQKQATKVDLLKTRTRNNQLVQEFDKTHQGLRDKVNNARGGAFYALRASYLKEAERQWKQNPKT